MKTRYIICKDTADLARQLGGEEAPQPEEKVEVLRAPAKPPSLGRRLLNFAGALAKHAASGWRMATPEQAEARLSICRACVNYDDGMCLACGCLLEIKVRLADQRCPLEPPLWDAIPGQGVVLPPGPSSTSRPCSGCGQSAVPSQPPGRPPPAGGGSGREPPG